MADYLEELHTALRQAVAAVWPDAVTNGVWEENQIERVPLQKMDTDGKLPFVVYDIDLQESERWSMDAPVYEGTASVYLVMRSGSGLTALRQALRALQRYLHTSDLSAGQVLDKVSTSWSSNLPPNRYFLATNKPYVAGAVFAEVLVEDDESDEE